MNQKFLQGFSAILLAVTLGATATNSYANQTQADPQDPILQSSSEEPQPSRNELQAANSQAELSTPASGAPSTALARDVVKVGEPQRSTSPRASQAPIAKVRTHTLNNRPATILYVREIPILTFLGSGTSDANSRESDKAVKVSTATSSRNSNTASNSNSQSDPLWRATAVAAKINQLHLDKGTTSDITLAWNADRQVYVIQADGKPLVEITSTTVLADTTRNVGEDALQATNRLRRLISNAAPIRNIPGGPKQNPIANLAFANIRFRLNGWASWYGPGFHGARSASGEIFNQNAMTAAHRHLPFGTRVRVTNLENGRSVVVRINDRGPFTPGRVIDLSAGAAQLLGLIQSGVAPVRLEVLNGS